MDISATVKEIISKISGVEESKIDNSTTFQSINIDSLDIAEAIIELEEIFAIEINDSDWMDWQTIGYIIEYLEKHTS